MEDPSIHWDMEEDEESSGKVSWILNKGLVFGKKILITGMVITSAPFVLPPLVAISALGVAASVPSGLFLATYACSEKVMNSLLPGSSPSPFSLGYHHEDVPETKQGLGEDKEDVGFEQDIEEEDMKKEEQEQIDDTKRGVEMRIESEDEFGQNQIPPMVEVRDSVVTESGGHAESIEEETTTTGLIEKFREESSVDVVVVREEELGSGKQVVIDETTTSVEEMDMPIEAKSSGRKGKKKASKKKGNKINESRAEELVEKKKGNLEEIRNDDDATKMDNSEVVAVKVVVEADTASTPPQGNKVQTGAADNVVNGSAKLGPRKIHHSGRLTSEQKPAGLKGVGSPSSNNEGLNEIRKQIVAMKAIVGYKGTPTPHASCFEELKALYLFTGVQPPPPPPEEGSFKDPSDIEELSHKLRFLMSIVGVK